uniref:Uncharacterized protein n=1 Tax=Arundo donax TaxID=35708 RepID=A0A0A8Z9D7_ARUDO
MNLQVKMAAVTMHSQARYFQSLLITEHNTSKVNMQLEDCPFSRCDIIL